LLNQIVVAQRRQIDVVVGHLSASTQALQSPPKKPPYQAINGLENG
jgi:hypothetical protein